MNILKVKLEEALRQRLERTNKQQFAKDAIISPQTLQAMLNDEWEYIHRGAIERVMDCLGLNASQVFESAPATFWDTIKQAQSCFFICGSRNDPPEVTFPTYALNAARGIQTFLESLDTIKLPFVHNSKQEDLLDMVRTKNCIVIGSPKSNPATEFLLSRFFDAEPSTPDDANRAKIPFGFLWGNETPETQNSSLGASSDERKRLQGKPGFAWKGGEIKVDFREPGTFKKWESGNAVDAGLVFVADRPFGAVQPVKLIILAGVSGIGTFAAAQALIRDFRDLQPLEKQRYVLGAVKANYSKRASPNDGRSYKSFVWLYRQAGRTPIDRNSRRTPKDPI